MTLVIRINLCLFCFTMVKTASEDNYIYFIHIRKRKDDCISSNNTCLGFALRFYACFFTHRITDLSDEVPRDCLESWFETQFIWLGLEDESHDWCQTGVLLILWQLYGEGVKYMGEENEQLLSS